jgi:microcystin-dependent protein
MPAHNHTLSANTGGGQTNPSNNFPGNEPAPIKIYSAASSVTMNPAAIGTAGGSQPHANLQPLLCVTFIIALAGIFPSRN